jgi:hypothetical protein
VLVKENVQKTPLLWKSPLDQSNKKWDGSVSVLIEFLQFYLLLSYNFTCYYTWLVLSNVFIFRSKPLPVRGWYFTGGLTLILCRQFLFWHFIGHNVKVVVYKGMLYLGLTVYIVCQIIFQVTVYSKLYCDTIFPLVTLFCRNHPRLFTCPLVCRDMLYVLC